MSLRPSWALFGLWLLGGGACGFGDQGSSAPPEFTGLESGGSSGGNGTAVSNGADDTGAGGSGGTGSGGDAGSGSGSGGATAGSGAGGSGGSASGASAESNASGGTSSSGGTPSASGGGSGGTGLASGGASSAGGSGGAAASGSGGSAGTGGGGGTVGATCGDGNIDSPEDCEPPGTGVCGDDCRTRSPLCGDGFVTAPEQCEPPDSAGCNGDCATRTAQCGDGFVTAPEDCDPADPDTSTDCDPQTCRNQAGLLCDACAQTTSCVSFWSNCFDNPAVSEGCKQLFQCLQQSDCMVDDPYGGAQRCYCGDVDPDTCFGATDVNVPQGPCRDLIAELSGEALPLPVILQDNFYNTSLPHGAALSLGRCMVQNCDLVCGLCRTPEALPFEQCRAP